MAEKFSLKWNDFATNVSNSFSRLRQETRLYDVTLVSNDHQQVSAHKLVLSACSEVFSTIFNSNNGSNMMLYLDSVDVRELNLMLDYIYQGEVQIQQEYLDSFIELATKFKKVTYVLETCLSTLKTLGTFQDGWHCTYAWYSNYGAF